MVSSKFNWNNEAIAKAVAESKEEIRRERSEKKSRAKVAAESEKKQREIEKREAERLARQEARKRDPEIQRKDHLEELTRRLRPLEPDEEEYHLVAQIIRDNKKPLGDWWVAMFLSGSSRQVYPEALMDLRKGVNLDDEAKCLLYAIGRDWSYFQVGGRPVPIKLLHQITQVATGQLSHDGFSEWLTCASSGTSPQPKVVHWEVLPQGWSGDDEFWSEFCRRSRFGATERELSLERITWLDRLQPQCWYLSKFQGAAQYVVAEFTKVVLD